MAPSAPGLMPILSSGSHRNPRKGACFMELASYLAGERWSDHPSCTHPLLASLARDVNDHVSPTARERLAPRIPDVIGLVSDDPRVDAWIALDAALVALPIVAEERQRVMALGAWRCEHVLNEVEGRDQGTLSSRTREALADVPHAARWAEGFTRMGHGPTRLFARRGAPTIVHSAVSAISSACISDPDSVLHDLLSTTIDKCRAALGHSDSSPVPAEQWVSLCELTGAASYSSR